MATKNTRGTISESHSRGYECCCVPSSSGPVFLESLGAGAADESARARAARMLSVAEPSLKFTDVHRAAVDISPDGLITVHTEVTCEIPALAELVVCRADRAEVRFDSRGLICAFPGRPEEGRLRATPESIDFFDATFDFFILAQIHGSSVRLVSNHAHELRRFARGLLCHSATPSAPVSAVPACAVQDVMNSKQRTSMEAANRELCRAKALLDGEAIDQIVTLVVDDESTSSDGTPTKPFGGDRAAALWDDCFGAAENLPPPPTPTTTNIPLAPCEDILVVRQGDAVATERELARIRALVLNLCQQEEEEEEEEEAQAA